MEEIEHVQDIGTGKSMKYILLQYSRGVDRR